MFGEDLILIHAPRILRLRILNPRTFYIFVFFCLFAIACAMSWDGEHVWGRTHPPDTSGLSHWSAAKYPEASHLIQPAYIQKI